MASALNNVDVKQASSILQRVQRYFFSFPEATIGLNELSKKVKASKTATKIAVNALVKQEVLIKEEAGNAWVISVNQKSHAMIARKIPYNLQGVYETGIVNEVYRKIPNARVIILFGSYRWGTDNETSDIDIAVEILGEEKISIKPLGVIRRFGFRNNVKVNLHIFSRSKTDINLFANIANGIVLDGFLEVTS